MDREGFDDAMEDHEDEDEDEDDDGEASAFLKESLGKTANKKPSFESLCMDFWSALLEFEWWEGGGVRGGIREVSDNVCFGVPGWISHMNGTAPEAPA